jgi:hypothetical protein
MSQDFQIIQIEIDEESLRKLPNRQRNQLVGCMHAHNELVILNRILLFSMNSTGDGELHDAAHSVQMWCLLQVLVGKLFETWNMLNTRFLAANPEDPAIAGLDADHKASLAWLRDYFGDNPPKDNALRTIRDKTAFHYDKLNLEQAVTNLALHENRVYLAQHPANSLYYVGSSLVFRTVFAMIADKVADTTAMDHVDRTNEGFRITIEDSKLANWHMHLVLYGLMRLFLENALDKPLDSLAQVRINVVGAPDPDKVGLPTFIDIGR